MNRMNDGLLSKISFSILFALSLRPRHGYELLRQIEHDTQGRINPGPGTLYGAIKSLREQNFIEEMPFEGDTRRRYYRLTKKGWDRLISELKHYRSIVRLAQERKLFSYEASSATYKPDRGAASDETDISSDKS